MFVVARCSGDDDDAVPPPDVDRTFGAGDGGAGEDSVKFAKLAEFSAGELGAACCDGCPAP